MKLVKVYINQGNEGEIICPLCDKTRSVNVTNQRIPKKPIKVKCTCGHTFTIVLEYRKYHRKTVSIPGKLLDVDSKDEVAEILITSVSVTGVGFELTGITRVNLEDVFEIVFTLDDDFASVVNEEIVIKRVDGNHIGGEFCDGDKYHYELDFYITAQFAIP